MARSVKIILWLVCVAGVTFIIVWSLSGGNDKSDPVVNEITCNDARTKMMPCLVYLNGSDPSPCPLCCSALQAVKDSDTNRQELCECLLKAAPGSGVDPMRAKKLPEFCKVDLPVPVDPYHVDCSSIPD